MKLALIGDTHWGIRSDSIAWMDAQKKFLDNVFFPKIDELKIKSVVHLGDLVDRRKYCNYLTANRLRTDFIEPILARKIDFRIILGNHDLYYRQSTEVNAIQELLGSTKIKYYAEPTEIMYGGLGVLFVPWITDQNRQRSIEAITNTKCQILFGHLELNGFEMHKGVYSDHGDNPAIFEKFDIVCSGHYHHKSSFSNIHYLGSPLQYSWSDYGDSRGFHVFDTGTRELSFINNPYDMFQKIYYDDAGTQTTLEDILREDLSRVKGKIDKIIVKSKLHPDWFDAYSSKVEEIGPLDVSIVDDHLNNNLIAETDITTEAKSTIDLFREYIYQSNSSINTAMLDNLVTSLYHEALSIEG